MPGREQEEERMRSRRQDRTGGQSGERRERGEEMGADTYTQRRKHGKEWVKVKTITRGAGSVRLCAAPWKCQALCSLTVSCTRRPESAGSLTKTDSLN